MADLDGDGDIDIVTRQQGDAGDVVLVWVQKTLWAFEQRKIACPTGEGLAIADMDGDGDVDVVIGTRWYETPTDLLTGEWIEHWRRVDNCSVENSILTARMTSSTNRMSSVTTRTSSPTTRMSSPTTRMSSPT